MIPIVCFSTPVLDRDGFNCALIFLQVADETLHVQSSRDLTFTLHACQGRSLFSIFKVNKLIMIESSLRPFLRTKINIEDANEEIIRSPLVPIQDPINTKYHPIFLNNSSYESPSVLEYICTLYSSFEYLLYS